MHEVVREYSVTVTSVDDVEPVSSVTLCKEVIDMRVGERVGSLGRLSTSCPSCSARSYKVEGLSVGPPGAPSLHCMTEPGCLCQLHLPQLSVKESIQETGGHSMAGGLFSEVELITILTFIHTTHHLSHTQHHYKISHMHSAYHCSVHTHYPLNHISPHTPLTMPSCPS